MVIRGGVEALTRGLIYRPLPALFPLILVRFEARVCPSGDPCA